MSEWRSEQLDRMASGDRLRVAPLRDDLETFGTPTWIWSVVVEGSLYVRAYNGQASRWYCAAVRNKTGRIVAVGETFEVAFEPVTGAIIERVDHAYRAKYASSSYLAPMIGTRAREATVRITPTG